MSGVNPLKTEVICKLAIRMRIFTLSGRNHSYTVKSRTPHVFFHLSRAKQCQPTCADFVIQKLSPQPFLLLVMVKVFVPWRGAFFHELPYVTKSYSEILSISYFEPCTNCIV